MQVSREKDQSQTIGDRNAKQADRNFEIEADSTCSSTKEMKTKEHRGFEVVLLEA